MSNTDKVAVELGETIQEHPNGGPVVSTLEINGVGDDSRSIKANVKNLHNAVETDLDDSYDDVHVWARDGRVAFTDHKRPIGGDSALPLSDFSESVVRTDVVETGEDCRRTLVDREATKKALAEFDADETVEVLVAENFPLIFRSDGHAVGIAPIAASSDLPDRNKRKGSP